MQPGWLVQKLCDFGTWGYGLEVNMAVLGLNLDSGDLRGLFHFNDFVAGTVSEFYLLYLLTLWLCAAPILLAEHVAFRDPVYIMTQ